MFERFTDAARTVVVLAQEEARGLRHGHIGTEHLLLGLVREGEGVGARALEGLGIALDALRRQVIEAVGQPTEAPSGYMPFTPGARKVLELSLRESLALGHDHIGTEHILLGLIREGKGVAPQALEELGADQARVRQKVIELLGSEPHPAERWSEPSPPDRLILRGIRVFARHGILPEEEQGQEFLVDLVVHADLRRPGSSDELSDTVDYGDLARRVAERVAGERWNLLERVAGRVAELVLEDPRVRRVEVTVHKPAAPLDVAVDDVAVRVVRGRR